MKTYSDVLAQIEKLKLEAEDLRKKEAQGIIRRMREAIAIYGLTNDELFGTIVSPVKAPVKKKALVSTTKKSRYVKYADGQGNTWAGGGSKPVWLRTEIERGRNIEDFRVRAPEGSSPAPTL